jgi:glycosyltransferase involved in cell wall biosynthesis
MKIALVHDYLREYGGAERVLEVLHELYPDAPLYTSFVDWEAMGDHATRFKDWNIHTSWAQKNWLVRTYHSPLRFLAPSIWKSFDLRGYDVVLSSSGWFMCRGVKVKKPSIHICYIHHPPRNLYGYDTGSLVKKYWFIKIYASCINFFLRHYDFQTAQKVDYFIANSKETARRVKKFYRRESTVLYPPVEVNNIRISKQKQKIYFLSVGRLTFSKRIDILIKACNELKIPLTIVGKGREEEYLKSIAGPTIHFVGSVSDSELSRLYDDAKALLFCARDEDFGIVPVEAMAHGVPVIAIAEGGVKETVIDGRTGILFQDATIQSVIQAIKKFEALDIDWGRACRKHAEMFSKEQFMKNIESFIKKHA